MKKILPLLALLSVVNVRGEEVPALCIGDQLKIALQEVQSITFDASHLTVHKADGSSVTESLMPLSFGTVNNSAAIADLLADQGGRYCVYTPEGSLVKQGVAQREQELLASLQPGLYLIRIGQHSLRVQTSGTSETAVLPTLVPYVAPSANYSLTATEPLSMQIGLPGIDPQIPLSRVTSLTFSDDLRYLYLNEGSMGNAFSIDQISTITFPAPSESVVIQYQDTEVDGVNPYHFDGVTIRSQQAGVVVTNLSLMQEVEYQLMGTSSNGYFRIYSEYKWRANLMGLELNNPVGPVINSQTGKKGTIHLQNNYVNTLTDGPEYDYSTEDQKGCIFSEGQLIFNGKGQLNVTSYAKHAIASDDYVSFENGTVRVLHAASDAVHAKDSVLVQSGVIQLQPLSDGIDCDGPVTIRRGENGAPELTITTTGNGAKGIKTGADFLMTDGLVTINQTGGPDKSNGNTSNVIAIKADGNITITGGELNINNTADGGKGLSAGGSIAISESAVVRQ